MSPPKANMSENIDNKDLDISSDEEHNDVEFEDIDEDARTTTSVKLVREKLKACEAEKRENLDGWQRVKADFINYKKEAEELRLKSAQHAREDVLLSVIPVLDSFEMAFGNSDAHEHIDKNWVIGMQGIQAQLVGVLNDYGVTQMNLVGVDFDPNLHDSVSVESTTKEEENNKVAKTIQSGYMLGDKVIRAAKVVVYEYSN